MNLSIVVPVYKEEGNISEFLNRIRPILESATHNFEVVFSMDPSPDRTEEVIRFEMAKDRRVKLLKFSRRFGQPTATLAGLKYCSGDAVVVIDVDLQDPPELILEMIEKWKAGFDVVYAQRRNREGETLIKRAVAYWGYKFIKEVAEVEIPPNTGDYRLMSRRVVDSVLSLKESHGFLRGMVALVGFKQTSVMFDRPARFSGKGNYNRFFGSLKIGMNGIVCFSNVLLMASSAAGFIISAASFLLALSYLAMKLMGVPFPLGNPTVVILVLFLGGVQLVSVGILGAYIGRIYDEVKGRPQYIVDDAVGFGGQTERK